jgi:hypothetical protein
MYRTEDGKDVKVGDKVYDYYSMKPGTIVKDAGTFPDPWFDVEHTDGTIVVLNGQRICTMEHAARMGWPGSEA